MHEDYSGDIRCRIVGQPASSAGTVNDAAGSLLWAVFAGLTYVVGATFMRGLATALNPFEAQFVRYLCGFAAMLPFVVRSGVATWRPRSVGSQFMRGSVHTLAMCMWFYALPHITLADTTAIGFMGPVFIMLGAAWFLSEGMRWERWIAAGLGFGGVILIVAPKLSGAGGLYTLLMLASSPVFAASFIMSKALTRYERPQVIVFWQAIAVMLFTFPLALLHWRAPTWAQWGGFALCGILGSFGQYCLTRSFAVSEISSVQSMKFLELVWATLLGWVAFGDPPSESTLLGGILICAVTVWIARLEVRSVRENRDNKT